MGLSDKFELSLPSAIECKSLKDFYFYRTKICLDFLHTKDASKVLCFHNR